MPFQNPISTGMDPETGHIVSMNHGIKHLHDGEAFNAFLLLHDLDSAGTTSICFKAPLNPIHIHMVPLADSSLGGYFELIEGASWNTSTGTGIAIFNHNRDSSKTSKVKEDSTGSFIATNHLIHNPTGISGGTTIEALQTGGGKGPGRSASAIDEWILKSNTNYHCKYTSEVNDNHVLIRLGWNEH